MRQNDNQNALMSTLMAGCRTLLGQQGSCTPRGRAHGAWQRLQWGHLAAEHAVGGRDSRLEGGKTP
jgi:hypothetical protein